MDGKALEMVVGDLSAPINEVGLQGYYDALKLRKILLLLTTLRNYVTYL